MLARFVRDYELVEPYSASRNSDVYLARKKESDNLFFLKSLKSANGAGGGSLNTLVNIKKRFKKEIDFVSSFEHRNISRLIDSHLDEETGFLVYPYNKGNLLSSIVSLRASLGLADSVNIIVQLLAALEYIHARGIIHGNIHPDNIFITSEKKLELFDFGYSMTEEEAAGLPEGKLLGTPPYIAPEQLGFTEFKLDSRTDLYCVGIILYQMIAGQLPITATQDSLEQYLNIILKTEVPPIKNAPLIFNKIILKALNATPSERYQTSAGFIWDLKFMVKESGEGGSKTRFLVGERDSVIAVNRRKFFVGRIQELGQLEKGLSRLLSGKPYTQLFYGHSGIGKTEIVLQFRKQIKLDRFNFLSTKCNNFTVNQPFTVLRELVLEEISQILESPVEERNAFLGKINQELLEQSGIVCEIIPEMRAIFKETRAVEEIEKEKEADRLIYVLFTLVKTLADLKPLILFVDNFQWIDNTSFQIFKKVIEEKVRCFFIWNYRNQPGKDELYVSREDLRSLPIDILTQVKAFIRDDIEELMYTKFGDVPKMDLLVDTLMTRTDGNPFTITEAVRFLVNEGILKMGLDGWEYRERDISMLPRQFDALALVFNKMSTLGEREKRYLQFASLVQGNFRKEIIEEMGEFDANSSNAIADTLENQGFILNQLRGDYCFIHDKLQDSIASSLDKEEALRLNEKLGEIYQHKSQKNKEHLIATAEYYLKSKNLSQAVLTCERAADYAREKAALEQAGHYYKLALLMGAQCEKIKLEVPIDLNQTSAKLGDVYILNGKNKQALKIYLRLFKHPSLKQSDVLVYKYKIGTIYRNMGEFEDSIKFLTSSLEDLKVKLPRKRIVIFISLLWELTKQSALSYGLKYVIKKRNNPRRLLKIRILNQMAYSYFFKNMYMAMLTHFKALNLSDSVGDSFEKGELYTLHTVSAFQICLKKRAFSYVKKSEGIAQRLNRKDMLAFSQSFAGLVSYYGGRWSDTIRNFNASLRNFKSIGDIWDQLLPIEHLWLTYWYKGELKSVKKYVDVLKRLSKSCQDKHFKLTAQVGENIYRQIKGERLGISELESLENELKKTQGILTRVIVKNHIASTFHIEKKYKEAYTIFNELLPVIKGNNLIQEHVVPVFTNFCQLLISEYNNRRVGDVGLEISDAELLMQLRATIFSGLIRSAVFPIYSGSFYRALGWYFYFKNKKNLAKLSFKYAIRKHHKLDMKYEEAKTRADFGAFLEENFLAGDARDQFTVAWNLFKNCGAWIDVDLMEHKLDPNKLRNLNASSILKPVKQDSSNIMGTDANRLKLDALLDVCNSINEVKDIDILLKQIVQTIIKATGAQYGYLFLNKSEFPIAKNIFMNFEEKEFTEAEIKFSQEILNWVQKSKDTMMVHDGKADIRLNPIKNKFVRSVLCVPIQKENRSFGYVYLGNDKVSHLFTDNAKKTSNLLATQAGILLENASLIQKYQKLNTKLEVKVKNQTESILEKNKKLGEFNLKLVESERMKNILTGTIVHDIKNYVAGIEGNLKVMKIRFGKEPKNMRSIEAASTACYDIISLTSNMLDIGRMEEGSLSVKPQKLPFSRLWDTFQKICYIPAFTEKEIAPEIEKVEGAFDINADMELLERVLQNLVNNAAKYTPQGGKVRVSFHTGNKENVISIFNSGEPISSNYKESIFDKYVRVGQNWSPYSKGLGLFFCKMVMNAHNGRIWFDTDESGNYFKLGFAKIRPS